MLFMFIEHFKNGDAKDIWARFVRDGRMMPEGLVYHASWIDSEHARCYQAMEARAVDSLTPWMGLWNDLIDFEVIPILASQEYWSQFL